MVPFFMDLYRIPDKVKAALDDVALGNGLTLFGCLVAGNGDLRRFAGEGRLNTDDRPEVVFRAPRFTYRDREPGDLRLAALLDECDATSAALGSAAEGDFTSRLDAYLAARDAYLEGRIRMEQGRDDEGLDRLLEAVAASRDFHTAYVNALQLATDRAAAAPGWSSRLLHGLMDLRPDDRRASEYLRRLGLE